MNSIFVKGQTIAIDDIVMSKFGRAKLIYIARQSFTVWTLLENQKKFPFGRPCCVEDNNLNDFIL